MIDNINGNPILKYTTAKDLESWIHDMDLDSTIYVADVPNDVYHGVRGWSSSHAKLAYQSEQRLYRYLTKPDEGSKDHFVFGELTHDSIRLTADDIEKLYCSTVKLPRGNTNVAKAIKYCIANGTDDLNAGGFNIKPEDVRGAKEMLDEINGRVVVSNAAVTEARELAGLVRNQHTVASMLANHEPIFELSVFRKDPDGFVRKCRPDCLFPEPEVVFDWKTTRDIVWTFDTGDRSQFVFRALNREVDRRDYGMSAAWYMDVLGAMESGAFFFLFADKDAMEVYPPYLMYPERMQQELNRCREAKKAIKSMLSKIIEGKVVEPLTTFLPNDDYIFQAHSKEYG